jgi:chromosome transmission fidelity protein 4
MLLLPADERAVGVAAGETFCAVATDRGLLRIFRASGIQEIPLTLKGPIVSMVAGNTTQLLVLYHRADPFNNGTQAMGYDLWDIQAESVGDHLPILMRNDAMLALPTGVTDAVKWIGFSDASMGALPMVLTSDGLMLGLSPVMNWSWVALLDTRAKNAAGTRIAKGQECWPVSVQDGKLMSVLVRSKAKYPFPEVVMPRPTILSYALRIPVLGLDLSDGALKHSLEEASLQASLTHSHRVYAVQQSIDNAAVAFEDSVERGIDAAGKVTERTF